MPEKTELKVIKLKVFICLFIYFFVYSHRQCGYIVVSLNNVLVAILQRSQCCKWIISDLIAQQSQADTP